MMGAVLKLTKRSVDGLEVTGKRYTVMDDEFTGLAVRVGVSGTKSFYYWYRDGKGRAAPLRWYKLGSFPSMAVEQARTLAKEAAALVVNGKDPAGMRNVEKGMPTVAEALERFLEEHVIAKRKGSTHVQYRGLADRSLIPALGKLKISAVSSVHIARLHSDMKGTPYLANRALAVLAKFFGWCESQGLRDKGNNPAVGHEKYPEHKRSKFMQDDELASLGSALAELEEQEKIDLYAAAAIRMLIFTGARLQEILTLRWEYVDMNTGIAHLPDSKTGAKPLHLPMPALALLESLPRINDWCFPSRRTDGPLVNLRKPFMAVCARAGLDGWRIHDLRHAFASAAVNRGHSLPMIGAMLGHARPITTARYAHVATNPVHAVAEDTAAHLDKALKTKKRIREE